MDYLNNNNNGTLRKKGCTIMCYLFKINFTFPIQSVGPPACLCVYQIRLFMQSYSLIKFKLKETIEFNLKRFSSEKNHVVVFQLSNEIWLLINSPFQLIISFALCCFNKYQFDFQYARFLQQIKRQLENQELAIKIEMTLK